MFAATSRARSRWWRRPRSIAPSSTCRCITAPTTMWRMRSPRAESRSCSARGSVSTILSSATATGRSCPNLTATPSSRRRLRRHSAAEVRCGRPRPQLFVEAQQIAIRVGNDELPVAQRFTAPAVPTLLERQIERPACPIKRREHGRKVRRANLQVEPAAERALQRPVAVEGPADAGLVEHQLRLAELQKGKALLGPFIGNREAKHVAVKSPTLGDRDHGQLRDQGVEAHAGLLTKKARIAPGLLFASGSDDRHSAASADAFSLPVAWSTTFMERRTLPRSSKPRSFTQTLSPSLTTSVVLATRWSASWEMWTSPSLEPKKLTKAPKSAVLTTVPW